jgi:hypothetical protein
MNDTVKEILGILDGGKPELQVAAAQILGELRPRDPAVTKSLEGAMGRSLVLGRYAMESLAKIGSSEALKVVARSLWEHEGLSDQAAHLLAELNAAVHPALEQTFDEAPLDKRHRILGILARHLSKDALLVFQRALFEPDLSDGAMRALVDAAKQFDQDLQKQLRHAVKARLDAGPIPDGCLVHVLTVLGKVDQNGSRAIVLKYAGDKSVIEVRAAALRALAGTKLTASQVKTFLAMLEDAQQRDLHDALRELLSAMPAWPEGMGATLKKLIATRNPEQKLFALRALRASPTAEVAKIAVKHLNHGDARFRDAAIEALAVNKHAIEPLARLLQSEKDPEQARRIGSTLLRLKEHFAPRQVRALTERAVKLITSGALAGELLFDLVIGIDGAKTAPVLLERAIRLRRNKRLAEALHILARLANTPYLDLEGRYQLALTRLLLDLSLPVQEQTQPGNPTMGFFAALARDGFPLVERLRREASVTPDVMLRIATHFTEAVGPERRFGADLLRHLATRTKGSAGEEAKMVLRNVATM